MSFLQLSFDLVMTFIQLWLDSEKKWVEWVASAILHLFYFRERSPYSYQASISSSISVLIVDTSSGFLD